MSARLKTAALAASLIAGVVAGADSAAAQNDPVIVVPGRPGVPVMMYGVDVSGAVIEGQTSLNRPDGAYPPTVIMRYWPPDHYRNPGAYFPATGHKPHYGRREVIPPPDRPMPVPAQPYYRDWMIESAPGPVSAPVPFDLPQVMVAPPSRRERRHNPQPQPLPHPHHQPQPLPQPLLDP